MQIETTTEQRPRGNPAWQTMAQYREALVRARLRYEHGVATVVRRHRDLAPPRQRETYGDIARALNEAGSRTWRGKEWTAASLGRLMKRYRDPVTFNKHWHDKHLEED